MKILHLDSSILGEYSVSRVLSAKITERLQSQYPAAAVMYRDLAATPVPHLSGAYLAAQQNPDAIRTPEIENDLALGAATLQEFLAAETVVIGVAFYNFTVPTQLKAWIDRVLVAGQTFRYTPEGQPEGLAGKKRVILAVARGGLYGPNSPIASMEHGESYLRTALSFIGITQVEVITAEGIAFGPEQRSAAIGLAEKQIAQISA
ncbi:FMN-dependent NADH-azoreductase [Pseudomonas syringae]|uniref:FMN-dependent NADH-azoreductase n=1 Tax=Pseudomonas syringae TaxID=317 RepID=UPI001F0DB18A|nr:NAD(P)H-dependent oxidoreductase [Pseudomonas syringae]MCH5487753.1 NAD(P)H-dependent oxidoreductase [Pseudomonas syringae pv. syringae]MDO1458896.1 NAD(P)H-dependent oxidoreductase [Pseudomonas syringae pv. syringae]